MSRVDDDRDEARVAARRAEQRRTEQARRTRAAGEASAFSAKVAQQQAQAQVASRHRGGQGAVAQLLEEAEAEVARSAEAAARGEAERTQEGAGREDAARSRLGQRALEQRAGESGRRDGQRGAEVFSTAEQAQARAGQGRTAESGLRARGEESLEEGSRLEARYEERRGGLGGGARGLAAGRGTALPTDPDAGGGQSGGGQQEQRPPGGGGAPQFRLNPALMAPVPVAQARDTGGSDRLRKAASELADRIVERVRVGTNAAGRVEFQVDLRADVLAGLTVKVSAHRGRITAVFTGADRKVLALIEQHGETLKAALAARGLTLEAFRTEVRP